MPAGNGALDRAAIEEWLDRPARQQPEWEDARRAQACRRTLSSWPGLVEAADIDRLRRLLAQCAAGERSVVQAGDCAEAPQDCAPEVVLRKLGLIDALVGLWQVTTATPVVRVGRIAGQYAKPRSTPTEHVDGRPLPVYRGHMVNRPGTTEAQRRHRPENLLDCYRSAARTLGEMRRLGADADGRPTVWTSHEALVLDYEVPLLRRDAHGRLFLSSTHWPWIGERTRAVDEAHIHLLAAVSNPVACKLGPSATPREVLALCTALDPQRVPGRLTFITRMGAAAVAAKLPDLVRTVREAGHPVLWMCDPMHANTVRTDNGLKTRTMEAVTAELSQFRHSVTAAGGIAGGVHLKTTPAPVAECAGAGEQPDGAPDRYTTLCDPRLNLRQALTVLADATEPLNGDGEHGSSRT